MLSIKKLTLKLDNLIHKIFFKYFGKFNSKKSFKNYYGFDELTKNHLMQNIFNLQNYSEDALNHWNKITQEIISQLNTDDSNFLRNEYVKNALHPDQYYFSWMYFKELRKKYSKKSLQIYCKDIGLGNPLKDMILKDASPASLKHFYLLDKIQKDLEINLNNIDFVTEFGGGYGSMCRIAFNNLKLSKIKWSIIDLPIMVELQKAYLKQSLTPETFENITFENSFKKITPKNKSIFIATWSLSETPIVLRSSLEEWLNEFSYIFIAFQKNYNEISNLEYFEQLKTKLYNHKVEIYKNKSYPGHYYLKGRYNKKQTIYKS
tara:strand:- start:1867 stop:2823 length:957 start_codon:yes stop_codon:yes gene_type:complete